MKDKNIVIELLRVITLILLYHISYDSNLFLYALTLSLYNIYLSCFSHITLKDTFKKINYNYSKFKILKYTSIYVIIICSLFVLLSIFISDIAGIFLNIENSFLPYLIMSLSIMTEPLIKMLIEYFESYNKTKLSRSLLNIYYFIELLSLLLIGILTIYIIKLPIEISVSLLYLSKIIGFVVILAVIYLKLKKMKIKIYKTRGEKNIKYMEIVKNILVNNSHKSIILLVKNSYYYISIIVLYAILSTRYSYNIETIENDLTFIYLFGIYIINLIIDVSSLLIKNGNRDKSAITYICIMFRYAMTIAIVLGITSPLLCKILFDSNNNSIYLTMLSFLIVFIILYNTTFDYIKNKKLICISLIVGIISKLILVIPLINSIYRMGYNLVYGDIISTIIGMFITIIINYVYIKLKNKKEKTLESILLTLYESVLLCIVLVILQFIVPIRTDSYIRAIFTFLLYITISVMIVKLKKKRG